MSERNIIRQLYSNLRVLGRSLRYNSYLKNLIECTKNKEILRKIRFEQKNKTKNEKPLISVVIATYNRAKILSSRTIPSVLKQTYQNFEIIIVGDNCTDNTEELIKKFNDSRIKFYNLPKRSIYPDNIFDKWLVIGVPPQNKALELCSGEWIAPLDDDDAFSPDHFEVLLDFATKNNNHEMVYGKVDWEFEPGKWKPIGSYPLRCRCITQLSVLYQSKLKFIKYDIDSWKCGEPADWNLWRRMKEAGVRVGFLDKIVGKHYLEGEVKKAYSKE